MYFIFLKLFLATEGCANGLVSSGQNNFHLFTGLQALSTAKIIKLALIQSICQVFAIKVVPHCLHWLIRTCYMMILCDLKLS